MFSKSLDNKDTYINNDNIELVDIMDSMYNKKYDFLSVHSIYRANKQCEMRPDYLSICLYGDEAYAEIAIKSAMIANPFSLEMGDLVYAMTLDNIYNDVKDFIKTSDMPGGSLYDLVKRFHKYIDKDKVPAADGSEENKVKALSENAKPALEPNISKTGATGIVVKNGKIYFGKNKSEADRISDVRPDISDGMSALHTGTFNAENQNVLDEENDDYVLEAMLKVDEENDSIVFDLDDNVKEDFGKYAAENVSRNNIVLNGTKVFFAKDPNEEPGEGEGEGEGENAFTDIESELVIPVNSDVVDCAKSGVTLGKFLSSSVSTSCK